MTIEQLKEKLEKELSDKFKITPATWHPVIEQQYGIKFQNTPSGCGSMIISNYRNIEPDKFKKLFDILNNFLVENGVGAIITTVGQPFYELHEMLEKTGFVRIMEYSNYRHGHDGSYKQYLYIKQLTFNKEEICVTP